MSDRTPNFYESFDARDWAKAWLETIAANPSIPTDEGTMISWFANALVRGYDERGYQTERSTPASEPQPSYDISGLEPDAQPMVHPCAKCGQVHDCPPSLSGDVTDARLAESARFAAGGYTVTTVEEACTEMDRLSAGWRAEAVARLAADAASQEATGLLQRYLGVEDDLVRVQVECERLRATLDSERNALVRWDKESSDGAVPPDDHLDDAGLRDRIIRLRQMIRNAEHANARMLIAHGDQLTSLRATLDAREAERDAARAMLLDCSGMLRDRLTHDAMDRERLDAILARQNAWLPTLDEIRGILAEPDATFPSRAAAPE